MASDDAMVGGAYSPQWPPAPLQPGLVISSFAQRSDLSSVVARFFFISCHLHRPSMSMVKSVCLFCQLDIAYLMRKRPTERRERAHHTKELKKTSACGVTTARPSLLVVRSLRRWLRSPPHTDASEHRLSNNRNYYDKIYNNYKLAGDLVKVACKFSGEKNLWLTENKALQTGCGRHHEALSYCAPL